MFYNTGIATYIWVLSNRKPEHRRGKVQLIDATQWSRPLRKNLGSKNCELSDDDIRRICDAFMAFEETEQSKIFPNEAFGYWKVTVERPLRLVGIDPERAYTAKEIKASRSVERSETAPPVIRRVARQGRPRGPARGLFPATDRREVRRRVRAGYGPPRHGAGPADRGGRRRRVPIAAKRQLPYASRTPGT